MINPVIWLLLEVIQLYEYVLIIWVVLSFLISFGVVNRTQPAVQRINFALFRLTDPVLRPLRKHMPDLSGIDISPIIIILVLEFIARELIYISLPR